MYRMHPMRRIAALFETDNLVKKFLARNPELKKNNEAVTASWDRVIGLTRLAVLNSELAESSTGDCCDHLSQGQEFLETAGEYSATASGAMKAFFGIRTDKADDE